MFQISNGNTINLSHMKAKHFYNALDDSENSNPSIATFWQDVFNLPIDYEWRHVLNLKLKKIKENKVKQFNFKLLHNVLPFKDNLFKWKITNDINCKYCNEPESSIHVLLKCRRITDFWRKIHRLIISLFKQDIVIDEKVMLIGIRPDDSKYMLINVLISFAQFAIYKIYILNIFKGKSLNSQTVWMAFKNDFKFYASRQFKKQRQFIQDLELYLC